MHELPWEWEIAMATFFGLDRVPIGRCNAVQVGWLAAQEGAWGGGGGFPTQLGLVFAMPSVFVLFWPSPSPKESLKFAWLALGMGNCDGPLFLA